MGKRAIYVDDCGAWSDKASCKTHHYIISEGGRLEYVDKKDGQYVKYTKGKRVPVDPQPESNIIVFKRYYITLKRDSSYKRRISVVSECPGNMSHTKNIAIVEYLGNYPPTSMSHGNSKKSVSEYVRTSCSVKQQLNDMIETKKRPRDIYEDMVLDGSNSAPRDLKQVQNAKYHARKNENGEKRQYRQNVADELQILLSDIHTNPFIQEIIQMKGKPPSVILYLEDNLEDIKQFCSPTAKNPSVLGIDRTFNLGPCYATTLVYQHNNLVRKGKSNPPIMLAAIYLHWDRLYTTYHRFFSHLQSKLLQHIGGAQISKFVIGSDEEAALTKAIKQCFPSTVHVLCTRNLKKNVCRYLSNKVGANNKIRKQVVKDIFGSHGLTSCTDIKTFDIAVIKLSTKYSELLPAFNAYFEIIAEKLRSGIIHAREDNKWIPIDWKNNSCESMNHIIKLCANWEKMKLPDLIERLHRIVKLQQIDCRRALHGQGNYELAAWMSKFKVQHAHWIQKSEEEKEALHKKFLKGIQRTEKTLVSTDGRLTIPRTPSTAKKPGQRKRIKNVKTITSKRR